MDPDRGDPIAHLGAAPQSLSTNRQVEHVGIAVEGVVCRLDLKGHFPFLGHFRERCQQAVFGELMLAIKREGLSPLHCRTRIIIFRGEAQTQGHEIQEAGDEVQELHP